MNKGMSDVNGMNEETAHVFSVYQLKHTRRVRDESLSVYKNI